MGKSKKKRANSNFVRHSHAPMPTFSTEEQTHHNAILSDISSLSESKRESGLALLSSMTSFNHRIMTNELLSKLNLRLVDTSMRVRVNAACVVRNIAAEPELCVRLSQSGIVATVASILVNELLNLQQLQTDAIKAAFYTHLVYALTSIWSSSLIIFRAVSL
jgi:hypothetical protein